MYISFDLITQRMSLLSFLALQSIKQKDSYAEAFKEELPPLEEQGYIEKCKNGNYKLTQKGGAFLTSVTESPVDPGIESLAEALIAMYEGRGKKPGKRLEIISRLAWFVDASMFNDNIIQEAVSGYLATSGEYTSSLENLIWKPQNLMAVHKNLKDSKLFDLISSRYGILRFKYDDISKSKENKWLTAVSKLPDPPSKINPEYTFTGDVKKDMQAISRIKRRLFTILRGEK